MVIKGLLQTWWTQYKTTEAETIKNKLQVQNIYLVADQYSIYFIFIYSPHLPLFVNRIYMTTKTDIVINALQFGPRRQLFTKQLLQAYVKTPRHAPPHSNTDPLSSPRNQPALIMPAPAPVPVDNNIVRKSRKVIRRKEKKKEKKKAKEEHVKKQENEFFGHLKTALRLVIEGNSKL